MKTLRSCSIYMLMTCILCWSPWILAGQSTGHCIERRSNTTNKPGTFSAARKIYTATHYSRALQKNPWDGGEYFERSPPGVVEEAESKRTEVQRICYEQLACQHDFHRHRNWYWGTIEVELLRSYLLWSLWGSQLTQRGRLPDEGAASFARPNVTLYDFMSIFCKDSWCYQKTRKAVENRGYSWRHDGDLKRFSLDSTELTMSCLRGRVSLVWDRKSSQISMTESTWATGPYVSH